MKKTLRKKSIELRAAKRHLTKMKQPQDKKWYIINEKLISIGLQIKHKVIQFSTKTILFLSAEFFLGDWVANAHMDESQI